MTFSRPKARLVVATAACLLLILALGGLALPGMASAATITKAFSWVGDAGYSAKGTFSYADTQLSATGFVSASGLGPTTALEELSVSFFDPSSTLLGTFNNVTGGVSSYEFLLFEYSGRTMSFADGTGIDIGASDIAPGEFYLVGQVGRLVILVSLSNNLPIVVDSSSALALTVSEVSTVPLSAAPLLLVSGLVAPRDLGRLRAKSPARTIGAIPATS